MRVALLCLLLASIVACGSGGAKVTAAALSATSNVVESCGDEHICYISDPMASVEKLAS